MSFIDIIVGVKNEEKYIKKCITSLQNQTITDINILVVDGLSVDKTPYIVREISGKDHRVKLLINPQEVIGSARNLGLESSGAEYVAYLDGHCYVDPDWLETLYKSFEKYHKQCKLAAVGSTYSSPPDDSFFGKTIALAQQTIFGGFGTSYTSSQKVVLVETVAFALYQRSTLEKENVTYDESMTQCEDTDFNYQLVKAGYKLLRHPQALVYQYRRPNSREFYRQMVNYGEGRAKFARKHPETLKWYHLIPLIFIIYPALFLIILLLYLTGYLGINILLLVLIPLLLYVFLDMVYTMMLVVKLGNWRGIYSLLVFPLEHWGYGLGFLKGLLKR